MTDGKLNTDFRNKRYSKEEAEVLMRRIFGESGHRNPLPIAKPEPKKPSLWERFTQNELVEVCAVIFLPFAAVTVGIGFFLAVIIGVCFFFVWLGSVVFGG